MSNETTLEQAADAPDALNTMWQAMQSKFSAPRKETRILRERKGAAGTKRADIRTLKAPSKRTKQLNIAVDPELEQRLKKKLKAKGEKLTDWLERVLLRECEGD